uniref:C-type lectin domain-containing protein n=1 Tax=Panagrolaimus davidi TaxID=227884 RepID=A0A914PP08_9BILA
MLFKNVWGMSLWDMVVKKEQVFATVEYEKRYLNVWRQDSHGYSKFYVTPLCVMEIDSIRCSRDKWSNVHRHVFGFNVKLWDSKAAKVVQNALKETNVNVSLSYSLPLPMQMVRVGLELLQVFKDQQIQSKDLTKDEWNSVFWDDIFARPDIQTDYANEVIKFDEKENKFKYDAEKDRHFRQNTENKFHNSNKNEKEGKASFHWFSLFKARARGKTLSENHKTAEIKDDKENNTYDSVSVDDFNKAITKENINIKWTGMKFEQKDLSLYRLNTKNLNSSNEIFFKRVVVKKATSAFADSTSETYWIRATDTIKAKTWSWIDNSSFSFNNWVKEQPKNTFDSNCAAALMQGGKWISDNCEKQKPFICEFKTSGFVGITLGNQTSEKPAAYLAYWPGADVCNGYLQGLIGLFRQEMSAPWQWTDGTAYDYQNWSIGEPSNYTLNHNYGQVDVAPICNEPTGKLRTQKHNELFSKFICKKLPT